MSELEAQDPRSAEDIDQQVLQRIAAVTDALEVEVRRPMWVPQAQQAPPRTGGPDPLMKEVLDLLSTIQTRRPERFETALGPMLDALGRLQRKTEQELGVLCEWLGRSSPEDPSMATTLPPHPPRAAE